jgi:predicted MFS family arabinose efflux permease
MNTQPVIESEWKKGWPIVLASMTGAMPLVLVQTITGTLLKPLSSTYGWSHSQIAIGVPLVTFFAFVLGTPIGLFIDRHGARKLVLASLALVPVGLILLAVGGSVTWQWYAGWVFLSLALQGTILPIWSRAILTKFERSSGLALGIATVGNGLAWVIGPPVSIWALQHWGWPSVFLVWAGFVAVIALPLALIFFHDRPLTKGDAASITVAKDTQAVLSLKDALRTSIYWRLLLGMAICGGAALALTVNMQALLLGHGFSATQAAGVAALGGLAVIAGRLIGGNVLDRYSKSALVPSFLLLGPFLCCGILFLPHLPFAAYALSPILCGLATGSETDMMPYMVRRYFGLGNVGAIYGSLYGAVALSCTLIVLAANVMFDRNGSYNLFLTVMLAILALPTLFVASLGAYRFAVRSEPVAVSSGGNVLRATATSVRS